ncbi:unnamed protein product [Plutella xylostella]|uniref:(diamondback moth) hypothetical protein n=1 Tax=Plutella xylostella TaxID=51655 RepID=A0A8S4EJC9_PLUXY|nr:unnamed protein product [Plutella xylostella]
MPVQQINVKNSSDIESWEWGGGCGRDAVRAGSGSSHTSCSNSSGDICRICHCESEPHNPLLAPCYCAGSLKYVHQSCLQQWLTASETRSCELCKFNFIMHTKIKPFNEWRLLEMSGVERRRLCCAMLFHCVAALCVMWSLFVLIERAVEEVNRGLIAWPFWTKLVVVAVGFTGGAVFMYLQCRQYLHLCNRWRAHNRILLIQNAPEKISMCAGAVPARAARRGAGGAAGGAGGERGQAVASIEPPPAVLHEEDESGGFEAYRARRPHPPRARTPPPAPPPVYHIAVDPLEANISQLLALDARAARSLPNLPHLRASRESLLPPTPAPAPAPAPAAAAPAS